MKLLCRSPYFYKVGSLTDLRHRKMHSRAGQIIPPAELAPCEPLLARANYTSASERSKLDKQAYRQRQAEPLAEGTGQERDPARIRREGTDEREQRHSRLGAQGLVCPGCGRSGVRGGVRRIGGSADKNGGEKQFQRHDPTQAAFPTNHINRITLHTEENLLGGAVEVSTGGSARRSGEYSTPRSSPTDMSSSAGCVAACGTLNTSLGVIVDICTWQQQGEANVARAMRGDGESTDCSFKNVSGENERDFIHEHCLNRKSCRELNAPETVVLLIHMYNHDPSIYVLDNTPLPASKAADAPTLGGARRPDILCAQNQLQFAKPCH